MPLFFFTKLLFPLRFPGIYSHSAVLIRLCYFISFWLRSKLGLGHCCTFNLFHFSHSAIDLLPCMGSLHRFMNWFWPSFTYQRDDLALDSVSLFFFIFFFWLHSLTLVWTSWDASSWVDWQHCFLRLRNSRFYRSTLLSCSCW